MRKPRCGLPDILHYEHNTGRKKWAKTHLTWNFHLADVHTLKTTAFAFSLWAANSSLSFQRKTLNPDILISYRSGTHTYADRKRNEEICSSSFDGPGGVLAHAFYPSNVVNYTAEIDSTVPWHIYLTEKSASNKDYLLNTLTHEIGQALGLTHSSREDSIMFAFVTANNNNKIVKLNIEDILAIQQLYGIKNPKLTTTTTQPPTTEITTNKPEYVDLCTLQYVDTILVLHHRIFVTYQRYVWSISIDDTKYGPHILNNYMDFLPENRPSGELVLFVNNIVYMIEYPSFKLKEGWPKRVSQFQIERRLGTLSSLGFPPNALIDTVVNTNRGQTYAIFNSNDVVQIDECSMSVRSYQPLQAVFPGIPSAPTLAFRYINGNLYFAKKQQFYTFNEFTRTVTEAGIRAPSQMYVGNLTLRFGRINNLPILRLETSTACLSMSKSTILNIFNLEHCVNRFISSLTAMTDNVDKKFSRFLAIASTVTKSVNVLKTMYERCITNPSTATTYSIASSAL
ncbi:MMP14 protein, partial [Acromyrmex charruanus]